MSGHSKKASQEFQIIQEPIKSTNSVRLYQKGNILGKGGFARVYEFINLETKKNYAGKVVEKVSLTKSRIRQKLMTEIKIHRSLNHPNVVKFEHFFEDSENVYILLEICQNNSLSELIRRRKRLTELEVQCYLAQIVEALQYLHGQKVIHRDIKLANLLLNDKMQVKLADFGLACKLEYDGERKSTICGTPNYIAPEIISGASGHSFEVDIWSLGVLAFTMLVGRPPFETSDLKDTYRRIKTSTYNFPDHIDLSAESKDLITKILVLDPKSRPTISQIKSFDFFNKNPIPPTMPLSSLAIAPSEAYKKQFQKREENIVSENILAKNFESDEKENQIQESKQITEKNTVKIVKNDEKNAQRKSFVHSFYIPTEHGPEIFVKKWIDLSFKYGIAYLLSNGVIGIYFNDCSKIVSDGVGSCFKYQDRSVGELSFTTEVPLEIKKKVSVLQHYRKYLVSDQICTGKLDVFVKKVITTQHAFIFRLNNKLVQIRFLDKSEVFINGDSKHVIYISKSLEHKVLPITTVFDNSIPDICKRMRYIKEILSAGTS